MEYEKGTQEQLDAAKEDATLLPFDTLFKARKGGNSDGSLPDGETLVRGYPVIFHTEMDGPGAVVFKLLDGSDFWFCDAADLEPIND